MKENVSQTSYYTQELLYDAHNHGTKVMKY